MQRKTCFSSAESWQNSTEGQVFSYLLFKNNVFPTHKWLTFEVKVASFWCENTLLWLRRNRIFSTLCTFRSKKSLTLDRLQISLVCTRLIAIFDPFVAYKRCVWTLHSPRLERSNFLCHFSFEKFATILSSLYLCVQITNKAMSNKEPG